MTFPDKTGANYDDSIVVLIILPLIWIFICLRLYVRGFVSKQPGWDDITAVIAAVSHVSHPRGFDTDTTHYISCSTRQNV
jgi:hypothetical protein